MTASIEPEQNCDTYAFSYPLPLQRKTGLDGMMLSKKEFFLLLSRDKESHDPKAAAFFREAASHCSDVDQFGYSVDRDGKCAILIGYDDWDELTDERKIFRGNCQATIAVLDRLRFDLEMAESLQLGPETVNHIRNSLNTLLTDIRH